MSLGFVEDVADPSLQAAAAAAHAPLRVLRDTFSTEESSDWAPHGTGGVWRRRQIDGILRRHGMQPVNLERPPSLGFPARMARALALKARFGGDVQPTRKALGAAEFSDRSYSHNARREGLLPAVVLESGGYEPVAIAALKAQGMTVAAVMPAINSLWLGRPNPITGPYPNAFHAELRALKMADHVFAIAREEQLLLSNFGVWARYLPYFPDAERAASLLGERGARAPRPREFLICATRGNTDTAESFKEQVAWIEVAAPAGAVFHVTGHQTESLRELWSGPRFQFHGTCPDDLFAEVKARCAAVCIHQRAGLGALTRVPDMLMAGLAVVANGAAARSFIGMAGVHVYDTPREMGALMAGEIPTPPPPPRPLELEDALAECLLAAAAPRGANGG
jgi:hypothetical protein